MRHWLRFRPPELALDVGTANTRIHISGAGLVLSQASVLCTHGRDSLRAGGRPTVSVGDEARKMLGRLPQNIEAITPIRGGVISNFQASEQMIRQFVRHARKGRRLTNAPRITVSVPGGATQVERRSFKEAIHGAGASHVALFERPLAAALGAGLAISEATGCMVVDVGAGTTEIGVIALGSVVRGASARVGGDTFDQAIVNYVRRTHGLLIGEHTAQRVKLEIGSALPPTYELVTGVTGRSLAEGVPRSMTLSSHEIYEAIIEPLDQIVSLLRRVLESTPPELAADIADRGFTLTGGSAMLRGLDQRLREETGLPVAVADQPMTCVIRGTGLAIETLDPHFFA
ncbi:rod shape-determining protein [Paraburkholderia phytofirmans]|uniref:Cell shape-determining protein MreB n=1 Tax=Paraburkholderia phytofirmans (strain DSM 17436 / LMG 22146 / PsJN) TaxID=398527 RepID=B2T8K8_PARPJ|nr:rod shape-determining protein [Paraburkholderia phytofirmans]ACD20671.1 cell shape determining protein, MreB/Mrl family [Paraburkholderia phytofirmans PsJN]